MIRIRPARPDEAAAISDLALRSKAVWGYDAEFLDHVRAELTTRADEIEALRTHVAEGGESEHRSARSTPEQGALLGFFTVRGTPPEGELDSLYVAPGAIGQGVGRALLEAARVLARKEGFRALLIHADPNAEGFYVRRGATRVGERPSCSIPGRMLPLLRLVL